MRQLTLACLVSATVFLSGCAKDPLLVKVGYDGAVTYHSDRSASIRVSSGMVEGESGTATFLALPNMIVSVPAQRQPEWDFNSNDQLSFVESLQAELKRLKIFSVVQHSDKASGPADVNIDIFFSHTNHKFNYLQEYYLNVTMQLIAGPQSFGKRYEIRSTDGDSLWTKINTDAVDAKEKAAKKLLAKLIPDIEVFLRVLDNAN